MSVETEVQLLILDQPPQTFSEPERDLNLLIRLRSAISQKLDLVSSFDLRHGCGFTENVSFNVKVDENFQAIRPYLLMSLFDQRVHQL